MTASPPGKGPSPQGGVSSPGHPRRWLGLEGLVPLAGALTACRHGDASGDATAV